MKTVFLETHNIHNQFSGFGQYNLHLLQGLYENDSKEIQYVVHAKDISWLKRLFGDFFDYKTYFGFTRYKVLSLRKRYDLWHSVNQNTKVEPFYDIPYVLTVHDVNFIDEISGDLNHPRNLKFKEKIKRSNHITYISEYAKKTTHEHFHIPEDMPETIIYNGNPITEILDLKDYSPQVQVKGKYLFSIGAFIPRKNFHALVEMMPLLKEFSLVIAGNKDKPYGEKIHKRIQVLGLQDRVILAGKISEEEKQYHLQNCTAFAFPSIREGFGLPPIEAMSFGKPIFLANRTSLPEVGGNWAFYWDTFTPEAMVQVLEEGLQTYADNKEDYKQNLKQRAESFNWTTASKQYEQVYKSVLGL